MHACPAVFGIPRFWSSLSFFDHQSSKGPSKFSKPVTTTTTRTSLLTTDLNFVYHKVWFFRPQVCFEPFLRFLIWKEAPPPFLETNCVVYLTRLSFPKVAFVLFLYLCATECIKREKSIGPGTKHVDERTFPRPRLTNDDHVPFRRHMTLKRYQYHEDPQLVEV
jgi:hypothetical protein